MKQNCSLFKSRIFNIHLNIELNRKRGDSGKYLEVLGVGFAKDSSPSVPLAVPVYSISACSQVITYGC